MGIEALNVPPRNTTSKYEFADEEVLASIELLGKGEKPGEVGYEKEGEARQAAAHLIGQIIEVDPEFGSTLGSNVWVDEKGVYSFVLKVGKRKPNPPKAKE
jgi:hypothetical protein